MDGLSSVIGVQFCIILLAGFVHASLQLELGALLLLYHASLGKHIKKKTKRLVSNYILGSILLVCLMVSTIVFLIVSLAESSLSTAVLIALVSILFVLSILIWFFYYKTGRSTQLWLPKSVARYINNRAKLTESNIEAFSLGMLTTFAELPFSLVLMVVTANSVVLLPFEFQFIGVLVYSLLSILPLVILRLSVRRGNTVVDIQKWRVKNINFFRFLSGILFLTLAIFIIAFKIMVA